MVLRATWATSQPRPKKSNKIYPEKHSLFFQKWNFLALIFSKEIFSYIFPKESFCCICGYGTLHFSPQARISKEIYLEKSSYTLGNGNPQKSSYTFSKESSSYVSGNENPKKIFLFKKTELSYILEKTYSET